MSTGAGAGIGSLLAMMFGLPPQVGAMGGDLAENKFFPSKDGGDSVDGSGQAISAVIKNLLMPKLVGQKEGTEDPYMSAIDLFGKSGSNESDQPKQINTDRKIYTPPMLMGFPSSSSSGRNAAIKQALSAKRGF